MAFVPPPPPAPPGLSATDINTFAQQRAAAKRALDQQTALYNFNRGNTLAQQGLDFTALARKYDQMRTQLPGSYAHRGLLNSGIYGNALQQYAQQRQTATQGLTQKYQQALGQQQLGLTQAQQNYGYSNQDTAAAEQARRADIAAALKGL